MIFLWVCGIFTPQLQIWWINLWYICEWVLFFVCCLSVWDAQSLPTRGDQVQANRKAVFLCLFLLIKLCFFVCFYFVWIIYYYYYSIINSEIKKEVCRSKKKMSERVIPALLLFFVLCCSIFVAENQENQKCGSLNSANITNDNLLSLSLRYQLGINQ